MSLNVNPGQVFHCPHCDHESVVRTKVRFDGWVRNGQDLICGLCQATVVQDYGQAPSLSDRDQADTARKSAAASFLGLSSPVGQACQPASLLGEAEEACFCRDCRHFTRHPFQCRCGLWNKVVEPMNDCERFERLTRKDHES